LNGSDSRPGSFACSASGLSRFRSRYFFATFWSLAGGRSSMASSIRSSPRVWRETGSGGVIGLSMSSTVNGGDHGGIAAQRQWRSRCCDVALHAHRECIKAGCSEDYSPIFSLHAVRFPALTVLPGAPQNEFFRLGQLLSKRPCDARGMKIESVTQTRVVRAGGAKPAPCRTGRPPTLQFQEIPVGGHFEFRGRRYRKLAASLARDEDRNGNIFMAQTEVLPDPLAR
jgi:hypothetical protein